MSLNAETLLRLRDTVDRACLDPQKDIPGVTIVVIGKDGKELFAHSAGKRGLVSKDLMTLDTVFWIASCTKLLTGLACMQLVEQGSLKLDDGDYLENLVPELKEVQVLREDGIWETKSKKITLRMLLTHTSGFGYSFMNERLRDWAFPAGINEFSGRIEDIISQPLLFQPGERWEYGVSVQFHYFCRKISVNFCILTNLDRY
jgi:CubicO group peptidase (beta-lactamase class C family)